MSFIVTFIAAVFVFSAVIAIHEFGHFMVAKLCGVQVNEFSIGMGPGLCGAGRGGKPREQSGGGTVKPLSRRWRQLP